MSDQPAAVVPPSADPAWFTALTAPASAAPTPEPVAESPADAAPPAPETVAPEAPTPEPTEAAQPASEPQTSPEVEELRRQVAELQEVRQAQEAERAKERQAAAESDRQRARDEYWKQAQANAQDADDPVAYIVQAAQELTRQESEQQQQYEMERAVTEAARTFPEHIGKEYGLTESQVTYLRKLNENPNKMVAGANMAAVAVAFRDMNSDPSRQVTKDAALEAFAQKTAADIAATGALATAAATAATPAPTEPIQKPSALRPGSPESLSMLGSILQSLPRS